MRADLDFSQSNPLPKQHFQHSLTSCVLQRVDAHHEPKAPPLHHQLLHLIALVHFHDVENADLFHLDVGQQSFLNTLVTLPSTRYANQESLDPKVKAKSSLFFQQQLSIKPNLHGISLPHLRCDHVYGLALALSIDFHLLRHKMEKILQRNTRNHLQLSMRGLYQLIRLSNQSLNQLTHWPLDTWRLVTHLNLLSLDEI